MKRLALIRSTVVDMRSRDFAFAATVAGSETLMLTQPGSLIFGCCHNQLGKVANATARILIGEVEESTAIILIGKVANATARILIGKVANATARILIGEVEESTAIILLSRRVCCQRCRR